MKARVGRMRAIRAPAEIRVATGRTQAKVKRMPTRSSFGSLRRALAALRQGAWTVVK
jgi:hypothetical protein